MVKFIVDKDVIFFALRYALGRMTFAPLIVIENIKTNIDQFKIADLKFFIKEIDDCEHYGMMCDENTWMEFKEYLKAVIKKLGDKK